MSHPLQFVICVFLVASVTGCQKAAPPEFRADQAEWLKQQKFHLSGDEQFSADYSIEIPAIMEACFGTPEHAWFPFSPDQQVAGTTGNIVSQQYLEMAAGAVSSGEEGLPQGLYREHCAECHGVTGDGAGPTAALLNPYPRDFRLGKFKFKSTQQRRPPTDGDLRRTLKHGIPGTAMPAFKLLTAEELDALVDYVKYLSIRGNFEKYLMIEVPAIDDDPFLSAAEQSQWFDPVPRSTKVRLAVDEDDQKPVFDYEARTLVAQKVAGRVREVIGDQFWEFIVHRWAAGDQNISEVPTAPAAFDPQHDQHQALLDSGRELFLVKAGCVQCHGEDARGIGEIEDSYNDWDNHWIKSPGVDLTDKESYRDFRNAGALRPRVIRPRNLRLGVYRGGGEADSLFRRIANGIEGTPMPAATALSDDEIWALVAYVKALPDLPEVKSTKTESNLPEDVDPKP